MKLSSRHILQQLNPPSIQLLLDAQVLKYSIQAITSFSEFDQWVGEFIGEIWVDVFGVHLDLYASFSKAKYILNQKGGYENAMLAVIRHQNEAKQWTLMALAEGVRQEHHNQHQSFILQNLHEGNWQKKHMIAGELLKHFSEDGLSQEYPAAQFTNAIEDLANHVAKADSIINHSLTSQ